MSEEHTELHSLIPGQEIDGDWFARALPTNIEVGENVQVDSSHNFFGFESARDCGLRTGKNVTFWRTGIATGKDGRIVIGDDCYFANASLTCESEITIGSRVMVSMGVTIADCDFHPIAPAERIADTIAIAPGADRCTRPLLDARPVRIGDDVWIGPNATILKGVTVGDGAIIASGAIVTSDVPANHSAEGNPARSTPMEAA